MKDLKLEVGMYYQLRNGMKARIYALDGHGTDLVHGARFEDGHWTLMSWSSIDGGFSQFDDSEYDIVGEWKPTIETIGFDKSCIPPWFSHIAKNLVSDDWYAYHLLPTRCITFWAINENDDTIPLRIPKEYQPKNYDGSWTDSLFKL